MWENDAMPLVNINSVLWILLCGVRCAVCDLERVRTLSQSAMPGGWLNLPTQDDRVLRLTQTASAIAKVNNSLITEAYSQVKRNSKCHTCI
jgi:hypothetical protein